MNLLKKRVDEKSLRKFSPPAFEEWVISKFNGKLGDPSTGINGFTEGGQPILIVQSDNVSLAEVQEFARALASGKAEKGIIVAFNFDTDTLEGRMEAMDKGIELQTMRISELLNKRFDARIKTMASEQVAFAAASPAMYKAPDEKVLEPQPQTRAFVKLPEPPHNTAPQNLGAKPRVFISNSNSKVADQVKRMLDFIHYDYVMGDKEETAVPLSESKFSIMKECDCAIVTIAAAEQERRYSGLYLLNSNVVSEINAAYLKYNTQVILLVEKKVELPPNLQGLKRIEYNSDDLSFNAAMDLEKELAGFRKI
ncbi:MAG: restriction endonuclease [Candidatus Bathyarchaeota archaeon]|nr:restriction endonuclease [Candidatus Bathyarchaeota archaeon]